MGRTSGRRLAGRACCTLADSRPRRPPPRHPSPRWKRGRLLLRPTPPTAPRTPPLDSPAEPTPSASLRTVQPEGRRRRTRRQAYRYRRQARARAAPSLRGASLIGGRIGERRHGAVEEERHELRHARKLLHVARRVALEGGGGARRDAELDSNVRSCGQVHVHQHRRRRALVGGEAERTEAARGER